MAIDAAQLRVVVSADTSKAEQGLKSFSGSMKSMAGGMAAVGGVLSATIAAPLIGIGVSAIKTAATFEKSMNVLGYVTEGTAAQMQAMSDQALQLGADTVFSANEAAEGMVELAKAGMDTEDVMGAIPGVMDLAAAGQISVAEAANLAAATLNTFGLEAEKSGEVADILAAAANASSADIRDLAFGVQNAGSVFATSGQSVETLATMMALLANNGLNASDAATSLKTMTMRLTAPTATAAKVMRNLGIAVFDADGNMRDYRDIVQDMEAATQGMSDAQRAAAFNTVFGADAIRAANIMVQEGIEGYDAMATAVSEQGAAAEMANAQNSGLAGAMEAISGSIDTVMTKLALPFLETISEQMGKLTEFVNKMGELPQPVVNAALAFAGFAAALGLAMAAIGGGALLLAPLGGTVGLVALALLGLAAAVAALWGAWELNWGNIQGKTEEVMGVITPLLETFSTNLGTAATNVGALLAVNPQWQALIDNIEAVVTAASGLSEIKLPDLSNFGTSTLKTNIEMQVIATVKDVQVAWSDLTTAGNTLRDQVEAQLTTALNGIDFSLVSTILADKIRALATAIKALDLTGIQWDEVLRALILGPLNTAIKALTWIVSSDNFDDLKTAVQTAIGEIEWGTLGAAGVELGAAIVAQLSKIFVDIQADVAAAIAAAFPKLPAPPVPEVPSMTTAELETQIDTGVDWGVISASIIANLNAQTAIVEDALQEGTPGALGAAHGARVRQEILDIGQLRQDMNAAGLELNRSLSEAVNLALTNITWSGIAGALGKLEASIYQALGDYVLNFGRNLAGQGAATSMSDTLRGQAPTVDWGRPPELEWPDLPTWTWPAFPEWTWPKYLTWTWPELPEWEWPDFSMPGWVGTLISILGGAAAAVSGAGGVGVTTPTGGGGGGNPELSPGFAAAAGAHGAGGVIINVYANVASDIDVEALAVKVANKFRQKMR